MNRLILGILHDSEVIRFPEATTSQMNSHEQITEGEQGLPLYSIPHLSFTMIGLPVNPFRKGFGFTGTVCTHT